MGLTNCRDCGNEISTEAESCPKCGAKRKNRSPFLAILAIGLLVSLVVAVRGVRLDPSPIDRRNQASTPPVARHESRPDLRRLAQAGLVIDRAWAEEVGGYRCSYVVVSWENKSTHTFVEAVTIQAVAYDPTGQKINVNRRSFYAHEHGVMAPGFKGTVKIPVELESMTFAKMECSVITAR